LYRLRNYSLRIGQTTQIKSGETNFFKFFCDLFQGLQESAPEKAAEGVMKSAALIE
jgi:hypothetical protein